MQGNYDRHSYNPYETLDDEMSLDANDPMNYDPEDEDLEDDGRVDAVGSGTRRC